MIGETLKPHITYAPDATPAGNPDTALPTPDVLRKPFSELNIFVTGGNRDIGAGIVNAALDGGAKNIHSTFQRSSQIRKAVEPMQANARNTHVVDLTFTQCDLTTEEGMQAVFQEWENKFANKVDVLVLNTSGTGPEINITATQRLTDRFLDLRRQRKEAGETLPEATIVLMQSVPGHYEDRLNGAVTFLAHYEKVGPFKQENENNHRARQDEFDELGVKFMVICPPEVEDTSNMRLFANRMDAEVRQRSRELSDMLGLPQVVDTKTVGQKVVELIKRDDVAQGHLELFAPVKDAREVFGDVYGNTAIYLTTVNAREGIGYLIANPAVHGEEPEIALVGSSPYHPDGPQQISLAEYIEKKHMEGHFKDDTGVAVFPGIKSLRQMAQAGEWLLQSRLDQDIPYRLTHYDGVTFTTPILPDTTIEVDAALTETGAVDAVVKVGEKVAATVKGMSYESIGPEEQEAEALSPFQLLEAAAQTFGAHVLHSQENADIVPLFMSTQQAEFKTTVNTGDSLVFRAEKTRSVRNIHEGNVKIVRQTFTGEGEERQVHEEEIGSIQKIRLALIPREQAIDLLKPVI